MLQLAYLSSTKGLLTVEDIAEILRTSRRKNALLAITGLLLYKEGNVLQVLEGEAEPVRRLFIVIQQDSRHRGVIRLYEKEIPEREFPDWHMGFRELLAKAGTPVEGYSPFMEPGADLGAINPSQAQTLLASFKRTTGKRGS